ncbi:unnamed protein product, partial [Vitis vinifera]
MVKFRMTQTIPAFAYCEEEYTKDCVRLSTPTETKYVPPIHLFSLSLSFRFVSRVEANRRTISGALLAAQEGPIYLHKSIQTSLLQTLRFDPSLSIRRRSNLYSQFVG